MMNEVLTMKVENVETLRLFHGSRSGISGEIAPAEELGV